MHDAPLELLLHAGLLQIQSRPPTEVDVLVSCAGSLTMGATSQLPRSCSNAGHLRSSYTSDMSVGFVDERPLVSTLLDAMRDESLEAGIEAACILTYEQWKLGTSLNTEAIGAWPGQPIDDDSASQWNDHLQRTAKRTISLRGMRNLQEQLHASAVIPLQNQRDFYHRVFEGLLDERNKRLGRASVGHATRDVVAELMAGIVGDGPRLLDPACGLGGSLIRAAAGSREQVVGVEISSPIAQLARMRLELAGIDGTILEEDWLENFEFSEWDAIVLDPPFASRTPQYTGFDAKSEPSVWSGDGIWLTAASEVLSNAGRAAVLLPMKFSTSREGSAVRRALVEADRVEALISLPPGSAYGTRIPTCLWLIRGAADRDKGGQVAIINGASLFDDGNTNDDGEDDTSEALQRVIRTCVSWTESSHLLDSAGWFAQLVPQEALLASELGSLDRFLDPMPLQIEPRPDAPATHISEVRLSGFKSIGKRSSVPLKPLTLVFGKNSAGKSSLIQSLLLMKQSVGSAALAPSGQLVDLGSFASLVHRHETERELTLGLTFGSSPKLDSDAGVPNPRLAREVDFTYRMGRRSEAVSTQVRVGLGGTVLHFERQLSETPDVYVLGVPEVKLLTDLAYSSDGSYPSRKGSTGMGGRVARSLITRESDWIRYSGETALPGRVLSSELDQIRHATSSSSRPRLVDAALRTGSSFVEAISDETRSILDSIVYLGPLRQPPQRMSVRTESPAGGLDVPFFLLDNISEREQVSAWMRRLGIAYDLDVLSMRTAIGSHVFGDVVSLTLTDQRSGVELSTADVGFGISQVLPIIVELSARTESVILIEQPEIHLHPGMQSDLADLLIESVDQLGRRNQVIAETHSEHLILRVQRRIREGSLDPSSVCVLYVDQDANGNADIRNLRLGDDGEFLDAWPHGFFAERFEELFGEFA